MVTIATMRGKYKTNSEAVDRQALDSRRLMRVYAAHAAPDGGPRCIDFTHQSESTLLSRPCLYGNAEPFARCHDLSLWDGNEV